MKHWATIVLFSVILALGLTASVALAAYEFEIHLPTISDQQPTAGPAQYVRYIFVFALGLGGVLAFASIVIGGLKLILAGGNVTTVEDARKQITQAILGLMLLLFSFLILRTINPELVRLKNPQFTFQPPPTPPTPIPTTSPTPSPGSACPAGGTASPMLFPPTFLTYNNTPHGQPGSNHGWAACGDPDCAVDWRPGSTCQEALNNAQQGVLLYAPFGGRVVSVGPVGEFGQGIRITDSGQSCDSARFCALLAHTSASVTPGQTVQRGQVVGRLATWACAAGVFGPHLHFELKMDGRWIVPPGASATNNQRRIADAQRSAIAACLQ